MDSPTAARSPSTTDDKTVKLAEKILIAICSTEWAGGIAADRLAVYALEQAESFRNAVNNTSDKQQ
jgi:hypothetical protein